MELPWLPHFGLIDNKSFSGEPKMLFKTENVSTNKSSSAGQLAVFSVLLIVGNAFLTISAKLQFASLTIRHSLVYSFLCEFLRVMRRFYY